MSKVINYLNEEKKMKMQISVLLSSLLLTTQTFASQSDNGFYIGADTSVVHFSADYFEDTADLNNDRKEVNSEVTSFRDGSVGSQTLKVGYKHFNKNRVEVFARQSTYNVGESEEKIKSKTIGLNYEWGLASLRSVNKKVLPFISLGFASGTAKSTSKKLKLKSADALELEATIGLHYKIGKHFGTTLGLHHRKNLMTDIPPANSKKIFTAADIDATSLNVGVAYHF